MEIYTYDKSIAFNTLIYCLMRSYHLPEVPELENVGTDTWIAVPAVQHGPVLSLANSQIENASLMMIDSNGRVVRAHRVNLNTPPVIDGFELEAIKREAFSIPLWEQVNQRTIPYASMFDKTRMSSRLVSSNLSKQQIMSGESTNITYNKVRTRIKQPCTTCGGRR